MPKVSLPNGKVIDMSLEDYLDLDHEGYQLLMALDAGSEINDPFVPLTSEDWSDEENEDIPDPLPPSVVKSVDPELDPSE